MKTILVTSLFILLSFACFGQNLNSLDEQYGFRDAKLGMPPDSFNNLVIQESVEESFPNAKLYKVNNVDLHLGDYVLDDIADWFYKGKLLTIEITVSKGYLNQQGVLKVFEAEYGKSVHKISTDGANIYIWGGKKVEMTYVIGDSRNTPGDIQITSREIKRQEISDEIMIEEKNEQETIGTSQQF